MNVSSTSTATLKDEPRLPLADTRMHMRGSFANISIARNAISDLILSAPPPGKVYKHMKNIGKRRSERY